MGTAIKWAKAHRLWILTGLFVPAFMFVVLELSVTESAPGSQEIPSELLPYAGYSGFVLPPQRCYRLSRWPNTFVHCEFRSAAEDADVRAFYGEMTRNNWKEVEPKGTDWDGRSTHVLGVYKQSKYTLVVERLGMTSTEPNNKTFRLVLTTK